MAKNPTMKNATGKPLEFNVNQKQGPKMGNTGRPAKRQEFIKEKSGEYRTALADEVMRALENRAQGGLRLPEVEPLDSNRGPKTNPTADGARLPAKYSKPRHRA